MRVDNATTMHVHLEENGTTRSDCTVHALSWMGKVPESLPEDDGSWKLNRVNYYQEGWLACGNAKGTVGATFTACHCKKAFETPPRSNFNLRGHRSEVSLVKWNEPYQKLATCDITGVIFVWIKHEGRWSIELINDRNSQVTDFTWSHDGRMALICYRDGFVLVGSVAGQRYWSSMLNLDGCLITCGIWTPDDQKVMFGTTDGQLLIMSATGAMLTQVVMQEGLEIMSMAWSCEKFCLSEQEAETMDEHHPVEKETEKRDFTLATCFRTGDIYLMSNYDDVCPRVIHTGLTGVKMEWSNDGEILAVCGFVRLPNLKCRNELRFYTNSAQLRCSLDIPQQGKPITALTWGHNDKRLFIAMGCNIYTVWVTKKVASLQFLCRRCVQRCARDESSIQKLPLPSKIRANVSALFSSTIKGYIPDPHKLREFVCITPPTQERLYCTMIRHGDESSGGHYTLYLEYLGGLIPLLKGKRASKIRPEFVIYDPKIRTSNRDDDDSCCLSGDSSVSNSDNDDDMVAEGCGSPRMQRKRRLRKLRERMERRDSAASQRPIEELMYDDNLPETNRLLEVTSNIWGTKFKVHALSSFLPEDLGHILYKTSLLHLQPRQMTISITELAELRPQGRDHGYSSTQFSESDDEGLVPAGCSEASASQNSVQTDDFVYVTPEPNAVHSPALQARASLQCSALRTTSKWEPTATVPNGLVEVPVTVERTTHCICPYSKRPENLSHIEIRSLDSSPPQRRSPSFKARSLSPAEPQVVYTSNKLIDGHIDGDGFTLIEDLNKVKMNCPGYCSNARAIEVCDSRSSDSDSPVSMQNTLNVVQLAARKLETTVQLQGSIDRANVITEGAISETSKDRVQRWAGKACQELKYIDDDADENGIDICRQDQRDAVHCSMGKLSAKEIMTSVQTLADACPMRIDGGGDDAAAGKNLTFVTRTPPIDLPEKRVVLAKPPASKLRARDGSERLGATSSTNTSICSIDEVDSHSDSSPQNSTPTSPHHCPLPARRGSLELRRMFDRDRSVCSTQGDFDPTQSASVPTSPVHKLVSKPRQKKAKSKQDVSASTPVLKSPLGRRRQKTKNYNKAVDSSDEEMVCTGVDITTCANYKNLETFQKAQLTRKLRKARTRSEGGDRHRSPPCSPGLSPVLPRRRHLVMHNKAPMWNENSQVYQLDFGGRVTQESAKNFQIEFRGKQVMQFGRIDTHAYTLDFQYPFTALQAFAVALANVTQRLK